MRCPLLKTSAVLQKSEEPEDETGTQPHGDSVTRPNGHGRNGAEAFKGAQKIEITHQNLKHGDRCPECGQGNVYAQKEPKALVRIVGQPPLAATVYSLERLRCGACGQVFTAQEPVGTTGSSARDSATGGDTVGDGSRGGGVAQTGAR